MYLYVTGKRRFQIPIFFPFKISVEKYGPMSIFYYNIYSVNIEIFNINYLSEAVLKG